MRLISFTKMLCLSWLLVSAGLGCSVRYSDVNGHDTLVGFPPVWNEVEKATDANGKITWHRLRRTGIGLNVSKQSFGLMIGYEHLFLLWVDGNGAWDVSYSPEKGMIIEERKILESKKGSAHE